ncbi:hypothetical protein [Candidatus Binatus sp.]|uniref:hypothetical protein n=1 Tax=Candidatus Binatus sp. TaxID=2811406 RepID=UPI003CA524F5
MSKPRVSSAVARRTEALAHAKRIAMAVGVTGVDFGVIYKGGQRTRRLGIRFHVAVKQHPTSLTAAQILPRELLGFPCDVIQAKYSAHDGSSLTPRSQFDPIRPGISIGNVQRTTTGTLGAIVHDSSSGGAPCLLSNWHVLCAAADCAAGEAISQPGSFDAGTSPARVVAQLLRWANLSHGCDAAIAVLDKDAHSASEPFGLDLTMAGVVEPQLNMKVVKSGLSSGVTHALVDGLGGSYSIDYTAFGDQVRFMDGIHLVTDPDHADQDISLEGDSGAVWIDPQTNSAVALHFGGEDGLGPLANYALAHPLSQVMTLLNITL